MQDRERTGIKLSLGQKAGCGSGNDRPARGEDVVKSRQEFLMPGHYFHGTIEERVPSILERGITPATLQDAGKGATGWKPQIEGLGHIDYTYDMVGYVGLSNSRRDGFLYATFAVQRESQKTGKDIREIPMAVIEVDGRLLDQTKLKRRHGSGMNPESIEYDYAAIIPPETVIAVWTSQWGKKGGWVRHQVSYSKSKGAYVESRVREEKML